MSEVDPTRRLTHAALDGETFDMRLLLLACAECITEDAAHAGASPADLDAAQAKIITDTRAFIASCRESFNQEGERP